jgi:hypothetical protein
MTGSRLDQLTLITEPVPTDEVYVERLGRSRRAPLSLLEQLTGRRLIGRHIGSGPVDIALPAGYRALQLIGRIATTGETDGTVILRLSANGGASFRASGYHYSGYVGNTASNSDFHLRHAGSLAEEDDSAFFPYVLVASGFDHAIDLTLVDHEAGDQRTKVHWHYVEDRGDGGRAATAIGWVDANEAHDTIRVTRTVGDLAAYDLALVGYL